LEYRLRKDKKQKGANLKNLKLIYISDVEEAKYIQKQETKILHQKLWVAFCFVSTMSFFRSLKFNDLMHRPLGRATLVVHAPFGLALGLGLTASLARPLAWWLCKGFASASSCLAHFGRRQNAPNTLRPLPRKNHK